MEVKKFNSLESFASFLNNSTEDIVDGIIRWSDIKKAVTESGWEFNKDDQYVAYDNNIKLGVMFKVNERTGRESAVVS